MNGNRFIAEGVGTFALVFAGCGAAIVNDLFPGTLGHLGVCVVFGLVVMAMIYSIGNISGAHINPAVTLGFLFARRLEGKAVLPYIGSQLAGAIAAALLLRVLFPEHETLGATLPSVTVPQALVVETALSFFLVFVILNVSTGHMEKGIMAGVAIGGTVTWEALLGGPLTGASMNPARSLGPAIVSGQWDALWLYIAAPIAGAAAATWVFRYVQGSVPPTPVEE
ncbi:MAG: aquaporin [Gemmatimonadota bacterium]|jgi:aquaporin Z|nr:aquaporin [Gemmatimonadota bacterium]MDP6802047.1 aquaporin [Gemmatimonadota bacterium]MDP7031395.1 aquaporin [Gemmatimonadota bacterium]